MWNRIDRLCRSGGAFSVVKCAAFAEENITRDIRAKCLFILHETIDFVDGKGRAPHSGGRGLLRGQRGAEGRRTGAAQEGGSMRALPGSPVIRGRHAQVLFELHGEVGAGRVAA